MKKLLLTTIAATVVAIAGNAAHAATANQILSEGCKGAWANMPLCVMQMFQGMGWAKTDSADVKLNRFNEELKLIGRIPANYVANALDSLVIRGYSDGEPKLKEASDWVCKQMRETPGTYINTCIQRQAELDAIERKRKQAEKDAWDRTPLGRVFNSYFNYATLKLCYDVRQGYEVVYINDYELGRAEEAVKAIVKDATARDSSINTDEQWQKAVRAPKIGYLTRDYCQMMKDQLLRMSPVAVYHVDKPE